MAILLVIGVLLSFGLFTKHPIEIGDSPESLNSVITPKERIVRDVTVSLPGKAYCSEPMDGVLLDLSADIDGDSEEAVLSQLYQAFLWYRNCGVDTVFIRPDTTGRFQHIIRQDGSVLDVTDCAMAYAKMYAYYTVLVADETLFERGGAFDFSGAEELLSRYGFNAMCYRPSGGVNDDAFYRNAKYIRQAIDAGGLECCFGCVYDSKPELLSAPDRKMTAFFADDTADFICVCPAGMTGSPTMPFAQELAQWNEWAAKYPETVFYCAYALDAVNASSTPAKEIKSQMETLFEQEQFRGGVYGPTRALLSNASVTRQISEFFYREDPYRFTVDSMSFSEDGSTVVFGGSAVSGKKLMIDRTVITSAGGPFAVSCTLTEGANRFLLRNDGYANGFSIEKVPAAAKGQRPSPYYDNGLGRALMCLVDQNATQPMSASGDYDTFHPDLSDLPAGMLDYVRAITFDEGIRYELSSGFSVSAADATLLSNAYVMPENTVVCAEMTEDARTETIVFETDWTVPVSLTLSQQPYHKGYLNFSYNIDAFDATYLDVIFYHTAGVAYTERLVFDESSPFARAEALQTGNFRSVLRLYLKDPSLFRGASVSTDVNGNLMLRVKKKAASLSAAKVMIDPGHGGLYMTGTALNDDSLSEKDVTLNISLKVRDMLRAQGIDVQLTREADVSLTLRERKALCLEYDPDVFVSIHCDGVDDMGQSGTHSFYYKPFSQPLAACVHQRLVDVYASVIYTSIDRNYDQIDKRIKYYPFYVTRVDNCPSILVESGFMSNDYEGKILADENCRLWIADAISNGIIDYLKGDAVS